MEVNDAFEWIKFKILELCTWYDLENVITFLW